MNEAVSSSPELGTAVEHVVEPLARALDAKHVAVFGASTNTSKWGYITVSELLASGYEGKLTLVNPRGGEVLGHRLVAAEHAAGADLAVIDTPAAVVPSIIRTCGELGIGLAVIHAAGFAEIGNSALQLEVSRAATESGVRIVGPNCVGFFSSTSSLNVSLEPNLPRGSISVVVQSGSVAHHAGRRFAQLGEGFDVMFTVGNKADIGFAEAVATIAQRPTTESLLLYLERLDEGDGFLDVLADITQSVPVVALMSGATAMGRKAALSHTGSMVDDWARGKSLLEASGVVVVDRLEAAIGAAVGARRRQRTGRRVFSICDGGGTAVLLSDALGRGGFSLPDASDSLKRSIAEHVPRHVAETNPLDFQGAAEADQYLYARVLEAVLASGEYDAVVLGGIIGGIGLYWGGVAIDAELRMVDRVAQLASATNIPVMVQSSYASAGTEAMSILRAAGIRCVEWPEEVQLALRATSDSRPIQVGSAASHKSHQVFDETLVGRTEALVESLEKLDIPHALGNIVEEGDIVPDDGDKWVLRLDGYAHKTDAGAIALGVSCAEFGEALSHLSAVGRVVTSRPVVRAARYMPHQHEVLATFFRSSQGSGLVLGAGGTKTESVSDIAVGRLPQTESDVVALMEQTKIGRRLASEGGAVMPALANCVLKLSQLFTEELPDLVELEINPIGLDDERAVILDILPTMATVN